LQQPQRRQARIKRRFCGRTKRAKSAATRTNTARWYIEPAKLHRAYPQVTQRAHSEAPHCHATAALEAEIASPRQVGELLRGLPLLKSAKRQVYPSA